MILGRDVVISDHDIVGEWELKRISFRDIEELIDYIHMNLSNNPIIIAYNNIWRYTDEIFKRLHDRGFNVYTIDLVDIKFEKMLSKTLSIEQIIKARLSRIRYSNVDKTPVKMSLNKSVSRKDLLRAHVNVFLEYIYKPVVDVETCMMLPRCDLCIRSCPSKALDEKPPKVYYDKCVNCGICYSICPVQAINPPQITPRSVDIFIKTVRSFSEEPMYIIFTLFDKLKDLYFTDLDIDHQPALIFPIQSINDLTPLNLLKFLFHGFTPVLLGELDVYLRRSIRELLSLKMILTAERPEDLKNILRKKIIGKYKGASREIRDYVLQIFNEYVEKDLVLSFPGVGYVYVDDDKCTLCEACVRSCPTKALKILEYKDEIRLILSINRCIGCRECEYICPENAVKVYWYYKKGSEEEVLTRSKIARCVICGAPLGPEKMIRRIENRLRSLGDHEAIKYVRICDKCKTKLFYEKIFQ